MCWTGVGLLELPIDTGDVKRVMGSPLTFTDILQYLPGVYCEGNDRET